MHVVADTETLVADGIITTPQAAEIEARSRQTMVTLGINTILCLGILSATGGLIFWLQDALAVAICGGLAFVLGLAILKRGSATLLMFGNAAALIGAGMLTGGGALELAHNHETIAGPVMAGAGFVLFAAAAAGFARGLLPARFVIGAVCVLGLALHLGGLGFLLDRHEIAGLTVSLFFLYAALLIGGTGWLLDVRLISALAIVPFAQVLDTGTFYLHAVYAFYSPEPTLSILQMSALIAAGLWVAATHEERLARHARIVTVMAFVVANLCALVGSLWGDVVGQTIWGPERPGTWTSDDWEAYQTALDAFRETALNIPEGVFSIVWAAALVAIALRAAHRNNRGLFNTAVVFGVIHAYTQMFESFGDKPLAYVIGGLVLIPVAWGMWRFDQLLRERAGPAPD